MRERSPEDRRWRRAVPGLGSVPADAAAVVGFVAAADLALVAPVADGVFARALVGLPLLFFVPGYALVSALFPGCHTLGAGRRNWEVIGGEGGRSTLRDRGVDWRERVALSFGASLALQPVAAVALSLAGLGYGVDVIAAVLSAVAVLGMGVAVVRRSRLPAEQRFSVPVNRWVGGATDRVRRQSGVDVALDVALAVVVVAAVAGVGFAALAPNNAESYTSVTLLSEGEDGELVAGGYPQTIDETGAELTLRVANSEGAETTYAVVGELQRVRSAGDSVAVLGSQRVLERSVTVAPGESRLVDHAVEPALAGADLRLVYYVYRGEAPADPSVESAHRHVHVWVDVPPSAI